jgi:hypothetical protein
MQTRVGFEQPKRRGETMRKEFENVYRDILSHYESYMRFRSDRYLVPQPEVPMRMVRSAIEETEARLPTGYALRPDARLFLTINLHQMVILPILHRDAGPSLVQFPDWPENVQRMLAADAHTIVMAAVDLERGDAPRRLELPNEEGSGRARERSSSEIRWISGGALLRAAASTLGNLQLNRVEIWG